jgi:hypothetical protein
MGHPAVGFFGAYFRAAFAEDVGAIETIQAAAAVQPPGVGMSLGSADVAEVQHEAASGIREEAAIRNSVLAWIQYGLA